MNSGDALSPANPGNYIAQFIEDGTVSIQTRCNQAPGSYMLIGSSPAVILGPSTRRRHVR
jgi:hypothetical protein